MIPKAASKQAPDIRPCSRSSGLGASPSRPSGSDPITLKYLRAGKGLELFHGLQSNIGC